jgi:RNA polymerase-binding transcription factor
LANNELDQEFIARQKQRLQDLKAELERVRDGLQEDERFRAVEEEDFSQHDSGDMSQSLFTREVDATVEHQVERRLQYVDRALQKIEEGTYGLSDESGEPIPRGRLEAAPEAIRTVEEEQQRSRETYRHRGGQI